MVVYEKYFSQLLKAKNVFQIHSNKYNTIILLIYKLLKGKSDVNDKESVHVMEKVFDIK